jgi:hypothetical protein
MKFALLALLATVAIATPIPDAEAAPAPAPAKEWKRACGDGRPCFGFNLDDNCAR